MSNFPLERYRFYYAGNKVIAVSTYGGKTVRGVAICHPEDKFNIELGKQLAAARCNEKIAMKRYNRANKCFEKAIVANEEARIQLRKMSDYRNDSFVAMNEASQQVDRLIAAMKEHN